MVGRVVFGGCVFGFVWFDGVVVVVGCGDWWFVCVGIVFVVFGDWCLVVLGGIVDCYVLVWCGGRVVGW